MQQSLSNLPSRTLALSLSSRQFSPSPPEIGQSACSSALRSYSRPGVWGGHRQNLGLCGPGQRKGWNCVGVRQSSCP